MVRAPAFQSVLVSLIGFTAAAPGDAGLPADEARRVLRDRLRRLHRQAVRDGRRFETLPTEAQHRVRKRLKRLRYLAEFVAPLFDEDKAGRYLACLRPAQDALGDYNDEAVALALYREAAEHDPQAWFAVGWFSARRAAGAKACRKALGRIEEAPRFWKKK